MQRVTILGFFGAGGAGRGGVSTGSALRVVICGGILIFSGGTVVEELLRVSGGIGAVGGAFGGRPRPGRTGVGGGLGTGAGAATVRRGRPVAETFCRGLGDLTGGGAEDLVFSWEVVRRPEAAGTGAGEALGLSFFGSGGLGSSSVGSRIGGGGESGTIITQSSSSSELSPQLSSNMNCMSILRTV